VPTVRLSLRLVTLFIAWTIAAPAAQAPSGDSLAIVNVTVIDVLARNTAAARRPRQTVLVAHGRITTVGPFATTTVPPGARIVDGRGAYLIPGLWDAHTHVGPAGPSGLAAYVANGVTTIRDLGGPVEDLRAWKAQIRDGTIVGPQIIAAGRTLESAEWLAGAMALLRADPVLQSYPILDITPVQPLAAASGARAAVDEMLAAGAEVIKFRNLDADRFRAVAVEARRVGLPLVGHAPDNLSIAEAAEAGLRTLEHAEGVSLQLGSLKPEARRAQFVRVAAAGMAVTPTLLTDKAYRMTPDATAFAVIADTDNRIDGRRRYLTRSLLGRWKFGLDLKRYERPRDRAPLFRQEVEDMRLASAAGVQLLVGTDVGVSLVYPGFGVHDELRLLVDEVRLSPLQALQAATINAARTMAAAPRVGAIVAGHEADFVLLEADPLVNIRNAARIRAVGLDGRLLASADLTALLATAERAAKATFAAPQSAWSSPRPVPMADRRTASSAVGSPQSRLHQAPAPLLR
jgi:imidazolonepropionase-like amidohydrolase